VPIFIGRGAPAYDFARYFSTSPPRTSQKPPNPSCIADIHTPRTCLISSRRSLPPACLPLHVLTQRPIDACLIALVGCRVALEPGDHIGIEAKRQLLFDGSIEEPTLGSGPVEELAAGPDAPS